MSIFAIVMLMLKGSDSYFEENVHILKVAINGTTTLRFIIIMS